MPLQPRHDPQGLGIVVEPAIGFHQQPQGILASMAEWGMPKVMRQGYGLGQIGVQAQDTRDCPRHLRHLDRMGQPCAIVIALMFHKDLRLVLQPPEGAGMDDPVPVALKRRPEGRHPFRVQPPARRIGLAGIGGKGHAVLPVLVEPLPPSYMLRVCQGNWIPPWT